MLGIALGLLFVSAATCSSFNAFDMTLPAPLPTLPLSVPLANGTMEIQCLPDTGPPCFVRGCCSDNAILDIAIAVLCRGEFQLNTSQSYAYAQYRINHQIALCHFDGYSVDNVQLLLTPNASALLDGMNRPDEQVRQQQAIYRALQIIGGHIGLPILFLFSIFSKTAQRDLTFLNFCFTWIFSSITFSLVLYRLGPASILFELPFIHSDQECSNQAALVSGAQAMTDTAMCALIVQLWFDFRAAIHGPRSPRQIRWTRATLLATPYVALLAFSLPALPVRASRLIASQTSFYCMLIETTGSDGFIARNTFLFSQSIVLLSVLIVTLIFDACIIHILYRRWRFFQQAGGKALGVPLSVVFRVVIFCAYRLVVAVYVPFPHMLSLCPVSDHLHGYPLGYIRTCQHERAYVTTMLNNQGIRVLGGSNDFSIPVWVDMLQAGTPLIAFLIFGTSKEFLDALMFWRWFNPILATSMCRRRRSPVTPRESNAYGEVVDHESVVSGDSVLDIRQETKSTDECLPL